MGTKKSLSVVVFILLGLIPYCFVTEAFCVDWVLFSTFKNGDLLYYDRDSIDDNSTSSVKIRTKLEYSKRGLEEQRNIMVEEGISESEMAQRGQDSLHHTTILWEMRCKDKVSCMLTFADYDRDEKRLTSHNVPPIEFCDSITLGAPEIYSLFKMLCIKKTAK